VERILITSVQHRFLSVRVSEERWKVFLLFILDRRASRAVGSERRRLCCESLAAHTHKLSAMTLLKLKELARSAGLTLLKPPRPMRSGKMLICYLLRDNNGVL